MTPPSEYFVHVWSGLITDPKHREAMGAALWTYLVLLDMASKKTGVVSNTTYADIAARCGISVDTLKKHIPRLERGGYVRVANYGRGMHVHILKYRAFGSSANNGTAKEESRSANNGTAKEESRSAKNGTAKGESNKAAEVPIMAPISANNGTAKYSKTVRQEQIHIRIFNHWNSTDNCIRHRAFKGAVAERICRAINGRLDEGYTETDITGAITNYDFVVGSPAHYWSHRWPLDVFLSRSNGFPAFVDESDPRNNFMRRDAGKQSPARKHQSIYDREL